MLIQVNIFDLAELLVTKHSAADGLTTMIFRRILIGLKARLFRKHTLSSEVVDAILSDIPKNYLCVLTLLRAGVANNPEELKIAYGGASFAFYSDAMTYVGLLIRKFPHPVTAEDPREFPQDEQQEIFQLARDFARSLPKNPIFIPTGYFNAGRVNRFPHLK